MYSFWSLFIEKKSFSFLLLVTLVAFGLSSVIEIPKESNPKVEIPIGIVTTVLSGASALDIEKLITNKLEDGIKNNLDNINDLTSTSRQGVSSIVIEFEANADLNKSIQELKDEVDKVVPELPDEATDPLVFQVDFSNDPIIIFAIFGELPESEFLRIAESLEDEIKEVQGVSDVSISGKRDREVQIIVNKEALSTFGLSLTDVISAIRATNSTFPVGSITVSDIEYNVQFKGDIENTAEIADIAILAAGGEPIYIRDLGVVVDGFTKINTISRASVGGKPSKTSFSFNVFKNSGGDITKITAEVRDKLEDLQKPGKLLADLDTLTVFDSGELLKDDLITLTRTGLQTVTLVMLLLFLAIGWREALIAGSAIPLSFLIAFIGLNASGNTLNFVSLFSLILAIGILVDSSIVIVEGINTKMKMWMDKKEAALTTIKEFHWPLTSGTMTTIAIFAPLFLISGITGEFIAAIPFTIIFVLLASLLVALGLIPLIASILMRRRLTSKMEERQIYYAKKLQDWYVGKLDSFIGVKRKERIFIWGIIILFIVALSLPVSGAVKVVFFDQDDSDFLLVEIEQPQGTVLSKTDLEARKVEEILYTEPDIESFTITVGATSAFNEGQSGAKFANAFLTLKKDRERNSTEIVSSLRKKFAVIKSSEIRINQPNTGPPTGTPVVIKFLGDDLDELDKVVGRAADILRAIPGTSDVTTSAKDDGTEFVLEIDKAKAIELGLNVSIVSQNLRAAVHGIEATTIRGNDEDIKVIVKLNLNPDYIDPHDTARANIEAVRQIEIQSASGPVLLGSVLTISIAKNSTAIRHENRSRIATVGSELTSSGNTREITAEFTKRSDNLNIPPSVTMVIGGENEDVDQSFKDMFRALIIGLTLMFAILVLQFNSYRHALYVLSIAPLSLTGILFGLMLTGKALSFPSLLGFIALSGIVVNNSIILIDTMNNLRRQNPNKPIRTVVIEGASSRLRPILLTTVTTVIGIIPLTFASELWAPLAFSIMFGLTYSLTITLLLVPILYNRKPGEIDGGRSQKTQDLSLAVQPSGQ